MSKRSGLVCLNKSQSLTHGNPFGFTSLSLRLKPNAESFTGVVEIANSKSDQFCQILHRMGDRSARLNFFAAKQPFDESGTLELWDCLSFKAGEMGAVNVLAQLEETNPLFDTLKKAGFTAYGWESPWKLPQKINSSGSEDKWNIASPTDEPQIRSLFQSLVPPIVQAAEAFSNSGTRRLVYRENNELIAYVESSQGPAGIYLKPVIHPAAEDILSLLTSLASQFVGFGDPVYLQVRSYQAWLLNTLERIGGESATSFALLVKHLAILQRNGVIITNRKLVENRHAEPSAPIANNMATDDPPFRN